MSGFPYPRPLAARRNLMALFFSPFGRIRRVTYLLLMPLVLAGCLVLFIVGMFTSEHGLFYSDWQIFGPALFLLITAGGSLILRRLHDVGLPGFFPPVRFAAARRMAGRDAVARRDAQQHGERYFHCADPGRLILADIFLLLVLVVWSGQNQPNRHGPMPD